MSSLQFESNIHYTQCKSKQDNFITVSENTICKWFNFEIKQNRTKNSETLLKIFASFKKNMFKSIFANPNFNISNK